MRKREIFMNLISFPIPARFLREALYGVLVAVVLLMLYLALTRAL